VTRENIWMMVIKRVSIAYERVEALGLLYNDHIFSDKVYSYQDALVHNQFRLRDILDLEAHGKWWWMME